jgi:hypothetical protein
LPTAGEVAAWPRRRSCQFSVIQREDPTGDVDVRGVEGRERGGGIDDRLGEGGREVDVSTLFEAKNEASKRPIK